MTGASCFGLSSLLEQPAGSLENLDQLLRARSAGGQPVGPELDDQPRPFRHPQQALGAGEDRHLGSLRINLHDAPGAGDGKVRRRHR